MISLKTVRAMAREAGYKDTGTGHGVYIHPDSGHKLYLYNYEGGKQNWQRWGENGRLPQPPRMVANYGCEWWQIKVMEGENGRYIQLPPIPHIMRGEELKRFIGDLKKALSDVL